MFLNGFEESEYIHFRKYFLKIYFRVRRKKSFQFIYNFKNILH